MKPLKNTGKGIPKVKLNYSDPDLLLEIFGLARDGFDDHQIAEILGVAAETFGRNKRKKQHDGSESKLSKSLYRGRAPLCVLVENALFKLAVGMTLKTITTKTLYPPELVKDDDGVERWYQLCEISTTRELPPDLNAIMLFLRARMPEVYNVKYPVDFTTKSKEIKPELFKIIEIQHIYGDKIPENLQIAM